MLWRRLLAPTSLIHIGLDAMAETAGTYFSHLYRPRILRRNVQAMHVAQLDTVERDMQIKLGCDVIVRES